MTSQIVKNVKPIALPTTKRLMRRLVKVYSVGCSVIEPIGCKIIELLDDPASLVQYLDSIHTEYSDPKVYFRVSQLIALVSKYPYTELADAQRLAARLTFMYGEIRCMSMNEQIQQTGSLSELSYVLNNIKHRIGKILGPINIDLISNHCDFTAGASLDVTGNSTHWARKLVGPWTCTSLAQDLALRILWRNPHYSTLFLEQRNGIACLDSNVFLENVTPKLRLVTHNKISEVRKNAKTNRFIAKEPTLNILPQVGIGALMRSRLKKVLNIDLRHQPSVNAELARIGSFDEPDGWCTIDLTNSSGYICSEVVRRSFPDDWYDFMYASRSHYYELDGEIHKYHSFCSMGNGFCFSLQTVLYSAVVIEAACELGIKPEFSVFGDDIIVRKSLFKKVCSYLVLLGFEPNVKKTYASGGFRESCGRDWLYGVDVRPIFIKSEPSLEGIHALHNLFGNLPYKWRVEEMQEVLRAMIPHESRLLKPVQYGYIAQSSIHEKYQWLGTRYQEMESFDLVPSAKHVAFEVPRDVFMNGHHTFWSSATQDWGWSELSFSAVEDSNFRLRSRGEKQYLTKVAMLKGSNPNQAFTLRHSYTVKIVKLPSPLKKLRS